MTRRFAQDTTVSVDASITEIRKTLRHYDATSIAISEGEGVARVLFEMRDRRVLLVLTLPSPEREDFHTTPGRRLVRTKASARQVWEQACRAQWRSLALICKAKLEAVASGIFSFDQEFMPHILLADGTTVGDVVISKIGDAYRDRARLADFSSGSEQTS